MQGRSAMIAGRRSPSTPTQKTDDMGFLKKQGRAIGRAGAGLITGGPVGAIAGGVSGLVSGGRSRAQTRRPPQLPPLQSRGITRRNDQMFGQRVNTGIPPVNTQQTFFPDIPFVPDLGDFEQALRGQNPFTQGRSAFGPRRSTASGSRRNLPALQGNVNALMGSNQIVMPAGQKVIADCPPGYVAVDLPNGGKACVLKEVARSMKLWKPRKKPPISASDWGKLKAADRVKKKAKKIAQTADFKCVKK